MTFAADTLLRLQCRVWVTEPELLNNYSRFSAEIQKRGWANI